MEPRKRSEDVDPIREMPDDTDAIGGPTGRRRENEDLDQTGAVGRPRPTRSGDMDESGMDPIGEGDSER